MNEMSMCTENIVGHDTSVSNRMVCASVREENPRQDSYRQW